MDTLNRWFESTDPAIVALVIMLVVVTAVVISWHRHSEGFNLKQVLVDSVTGKIAIEKVGYMTALALSSWGFVAMMLKDRMTEWYFTVYIGAFALARVASQGVAVWKDVNANKPTTQP